MADPGSALIAASTPTETADTATANGQGRSEKVFATKAEMANTDKLRKTE